MQKVWQKSLCQVSPPGYSFCRFVRRRVCYFPDVDLVVDLDLDGFYADLSSSGWLLAVGRDDAVIADALNPIMGRVNKIHEYHHETDGRLQH